MSEDGGRVDYQGMQRSPQFESYCQLAASLRKVVIEVILILKIRKKSTIVLKNLNLALKKGTHGELETSTYRERL